MNIGIVTTWFERGAGYVSKNFFNALREKNNTFIYARGGESYAVGDKKWDLPEVTWGKRVENKILTYIDKKDFLNWIEKHNIELILFNEQHWWYPPLWCKELGVKVGSYIDYYTEQTIPFFEVYDFLICNTKQHYRAFKWHKNAIYLPWGTDTNIFIPDKKTIFKTDDIVFFHSAGMNPYRKGTDLLLKAFAQIKSDKAKLLIHIQANTQKYFKETHQLLNESKKDSRIKVVSKTIHAPGLYHEGDVYVYPSRLDGIGLTIAEAVSCGLALITTDNPPMNDFLDESFGKRIKVDKEFQRDDGYYWPMVEVDVKDLINHMNYFIENPETIKTYKNAARRYAVENLNWIKNTSTLTSSLKSINTLDIAQNIKYSIINYEETRFPNSIEKPYLYFSSERKLIKYLFHQTKEKIIKFIL